MVHESIGMPSTCTVHAPQEESSQARLEPVKSRSWRKTSSSSLFGSIPSSCVRPLTCSSMSSFFIRAVLGSWYLILRRGTRPSTNYQLLSSIHRDGGINLPRPAVDSALQRLHFLEALLPQPCGDVHRAHSVMAHDHNVLFGIELLIETRRDITHHNVLATVDFSDLVLPQLANIKHGDVVSSIAQRFQLFWSDLVIHRTISLSISADGVR